MANATILNSTALAHTGGEEPHLEAPAEEPEDSKCSL